MHHQNTAPATNVVALRPEDDAAELRRRIHRMSDDAQRIYQRLLSVHASVGVGAHGILDSWTDEQLDEIGDIAAEVANLVGVIV